MIVLTKIPFWWPSDKPWIIDDCLGVMKQMPQESVDLVLTDPPYGISYESNRYKDKNPFGSIDGDDEINTEWLDNAENILKRDSGMFIFTREDVYPEWKMKIGWEFTFKRMLVWVKNNHSMGDLEGNFASQKELIIYTTKGSPRIRGKRPKDVLRYDRVPPSALKHPTQKPTGLIEFLIRKLTDEGDIIFDPFLGSGTTLKACRNTDRIGLGCEINPEYESIIEKRSLNNVKRIDDYD